MTLMILNPRTPKYIPRFNVNTDRASPRNYDSEFIFKTSY